MGGISASVFSYLAGFLIFGYRQPMNFSLSEYLDIVFDMYLVSSSLCGLPGLALSLFVLRVAILRPKKPNRFAIIVIVITLAVFNLVIGFGVGMINMLDLSYH